MRGGEAKEKYATLIADVLGWITNHEEIEITHDLLKTKETDMVDDNFYVPSLLDYINGPLGQNCYIWQRKRRG